MSDSTFTIEFENVSDKDGNIYASELKKAILNASSDVQVTQERKNPDSQDLGSTIVLVLSTGAASAVASGIAAWLVQRHKASISIDGERVDVKNVTGDVVTKIAEIFRRKSENQDGSITTN